VTRRLPPLNQLRAFEAAARHLSFKDAANELNVTHAAVSHQIKALEEFFGRQLFQRHARGVRLTKKAEALSADLIQAFVLMESAVNTFNSSEMTGTLRITAVPLYANRLIIPNLPDFHAAHPGLEVDLAYSYEVIDLQNSDFHAAVRHGVGDWMNLSAYRLHNDCVSPVCVPELVAGQELPLSTDQIARMDLAVGKGYEEYWRLWLTGAGVSSDINLNFIEFDNRALALEFALAGNGVSLSDMPFMQTAFRLGQLVRLHPHAVTLETGMHLVFPPSPHPDPRLLAFANWIKELLYEMD
jgi:LysR family glycine cleavage system transcriptional activator